MKNRKIVLPLAAAVFLAAAAAAFFALFTFADGMLVPRRAESIDLRGREISAERLAELREKFPNAEILWDITIGGKTFAGDARDIITEDFTAAEVSAFARLERLQSADVSACGDMAAIAALREALPNVRVFWNVSLVSETIDGDSTAVTVRTASAEELRAALERLPSLASLTLTESTLTPAEQLALRENFPAVDFVWNVTIASRRFPADTATLDFTDTPLTENDLAEIEAALPLFPSLEGVSFTRSGLPESAIRSFADRHPELSVVWETELFGVRFSTDAEEIDFTDIPLTIEDAAQIEALLPYMPDLKKVVMVRCGISNEDMDALNLRHDRVQFVWMVQVRIWGLRTDRTYFTVYNNDYEFPTDNRSFADLRYCRDMVAIDLGHQKFYDDPDMFENFPKLRYLVVSNCQYETLPALAHLESLVMLELFWTNMSDITPLRDLENLRHLNITYKRVRDAEADLDTLMHMTWLERLWISYNMYSDEQIAALKAALPDTQVQVIYTTDCVSQGWRNGSVEYFNMRDALHMYYLDDDSNHVYVNPYTGEPSRYDDTDPFR